METTDRRAHQWWHSQRLRPFGVWVLLVLVLYNIFRAGTLWSCRTRLDDVSVTQILQCFGVGLLFDGFVLGVTGLPLVLALSLASGRVFTGAWFRRAVTVYLTALLFILSFVEVAGYYFFQQFGFKLNWFALDSLLCPREIAEYIWTDYPVVWVFLGLGLLCTAVYLGLRRLLWSGEAPPEPPRHRPLVAAVLLGACFLSILGWAVGGSPTTGRAYTLSTNNVLSQAAMNNVSTLEEAILTEMRSTEAPPPGYDFPPVDRMTALVREMFYQRRDQDLGEAANPLWRRTSTGRTPLDYNVVLIVAEKMSGDGVGLLGHPKPPQTPYLDALAAQGLYFSRMYAAGMETRRGLISTICGHPDTCLRSAMVEPTAHRPFLMLPGLLHERGYKTVLFFGGRAAWENIKGFFVRDGGFEEFIGQEDMQEGALVTTWGVPDEVIFRNVHKRLLAYGDRPFFAAIMTITNHEPFNAPPVEGLEYVPGDSPEAKRINCYRYADWAIGHFLDQARQAPYFKKTIFVIVADHGRDFAADQTLDIPAYHIPCIIYAPGLVAPQRISTVCSQTDVAPTILSLLGGEFDHCFFGRNVLDVAPSDGFAFIHANGILGFVQGNQALVRPPGRAITLYRVDNESMTPLPPEVAAASIPPLHDKMLSIYGWAAKLYRESRYGPPPERVPATAK